MIYTSRVEAQRESYSSCDSTRWYSGATLSQARSSSTTEGGAEYSSSRRALLIPRSSLIGLEIVAQRSCANSQISLPDRHFTPSDV